MWDHRLLQKYFLSVQRGVVHNTDTSLISGCNLLWLWDHTHADWILLTASFPQRIARGICHIFSSCSRDLMYHKLTSGLYIVLKSSIPKIFSALKFRCILNARVFLMRCLTVENSTKKRDCTLGHQQQK